MDFVIKIFVSPHYGCVIRTMGSLGYCWTLQRVAGTSASLSWTM